eukprot:15464673-Alexandrium_andersonii.AAC.1
MPAEPDLRLASLPVAQSGSAPGAPADTPISDLHALDTNRFAGPAGPDTSLTEDASPPAPASPAAALDDQPAAKREPAGLSAADLHAAVEAAQLAAPAGPDALLAEGPLQREPSVGRRPVFMGGAEGEQSNPWFNSFVARTSQPVSAAGPAPSCYGTPKSSPSQ